MAPIPFDTASRTDLRKRIARAFDARRRSLAVDMDARMITLAPAAQQPDVALMELDAPGFRIATTTPVPVDAVFMSELMREDGTHVQRLARVAYCQPQRADGQDGGYVSRLEFLDGPEAA